MELNELQGSSWQETGRWLGYEENVSPATGVWSSAHVSYLTFKSLIQLRKTMSTGLTHTHTHVHRQKDTDTKTQTQRHRHRDTLTHTHTQLGDCQGTRFTLSDTDRQTGTQTEILTDGWLEMEDIYYKLTD